MLYDVLFDFVSLMSSLNHHFLKRIVKNQFAVFTKGIFFFFFKFLWYNRTPEHLWFRVFRSVSEPFWAVRSIENLKGRMTNTFRKCMYVIQFRYVYSIELNWKLSTLIHICYSYSAKYFYSIFQISDLMLPCWYQIYMYTFLSWKIYMYTFPSWKIFKCEQCKIIS